jgi:predicted amidophosphoribosyltransferase
MSVVICTHDGVEKTKQTRVPVFAAKPFIVDSDVHRMIVELKYHNRRSRAVVLGDLLAASIRANESIDFATFDVVTWAPTSIAHRRRRGFDQAELIARRVGRQLDIPVRALLRRRGSNAQTGRSRRDRLAGPVFVAHRAARGARVLVLDDVTTTGATLHAARRAFRSVGAELTVCWAVAATPAR